ncbi:hypothetical protein MHYP_G00084550 [Metynnis hypsauchen]
MVSEGRVQPSSLKKDPNVFGTERFPPFGFIAFWLQPGQKDTSRKNANTALIQSITGQQLPKKSAVQPLILSPDLLSGHGEFGCTICGERCFSLAQLAKHVQFLDRDQPFPCAICGKRFLSRSHHAEHQRVHTGERPFPCNRCERAFTTHHNLKRHQLIHDKEEMYRCSVCGVLFCQEHQLGNIGGIIRVLKQHNMGDLIDPQELQEPESVPEPEPAVETLPNLSLKTKEEPKLRKKKTKHSNEHFHLVEDHSPFPGREGKDSQLSFHSNVAQIRTSKEKDFSNLVHRTGSNC